MTLATDWDFRDLTGWLWSEKFDGCRAYWDGQRLWTREGNIIQAPSSFTNQLPAGRHLDGEIWAGRGNYIAAMNAVRHGIWSDAVRFVVFDAPHVDGSWMWRMECAEAMLEGCAIAGTCERGVVSERYEASTLADQFIQSGGEGAMFRSPDVKTYETKRTIHLMRIKAANLKEPWRKAGWFRSSAGQYGPLGCLAKKDHGQRNGKKQKRIKDDSRKAVGFDFRLAAFDPAVEYKVRQIMEA